MAIGTVFPGVAPGAAPRSVKTACARESAGVTKKIRIARRTAAPRSRGRTITGSFNQVRGRRRRASTGARLDDQELTNCADENCSEIVRWAATRCTFCSAQESEARAILRPPGVRL